MEEQIQALREQIDILEDRQKYESVTRRAALNVMKRHDLMGEYAEELSTLAKLGDTAAIHYEQRRPFLPLDRPIVGDCSAYELGETTWNDPLTGTHTGLRCLERHPEHPTMQCMKKRGHENLIRKDAPTTHYFSFGGNHTIHWEESHG